jgi:hypothetical protein
MHISKILNLAGKSIEVFWVDDLNKAVKLSDPLPNNTATGVSQLYIYILNHCAAVLD